MKKNQIEVVVWAMAFGLLWAVASWAGPEPRKGAAGRNAGGERAALVGEWAVDPDHRGMDESLCAGTLFIYRNAVSNKLQSPTKVKLVFTANTVQELYLLDRVAFGRQSYAPEPQVIKDADGKEWGYFQYSYSVNVSTSPHQIDLRWNTGTKDIVGKGIWEVRDGVLLIAIQHDNGFFQGRPTSFEKDNTYKSFLRATSAASGGPAR